MSGVSNPALDAKVRSTYRPIQKNSTTVPTDIYVDSSTGSDTSGDGTSGAPVATYTKAVSLAPQDVGSNVNLNFAGAGPYAVPLVNDTQTNLSIVGTETVVETRSISSVSSISTNGGIVFVVSGTTLTDGIWKNRHLSVTGVLSNTRNIAVIDNVGNTVYGVMYTRASVSSAQTSPAGGSVNLLQFTEFALSGTTSFINSIQLNFKNCYFSGNQTLFANATDKVQFWKCRMEVGSINAGRGGGIYLHSSTIGNFGNSTSGVIAARTGADVRIGYGSVITNKNSGANNNFVSIDLNAMLSFEEGCVFSSLDSKGIQVENGFINVVSQANLKVIFDKSKGTANCASAFKINSNGGVGTSYNLPNCQGGITGAYLVAAKNGANVVVDSSSSVTTSGNTNAVSADGGSNPSCINVNDGTRIRNGSPSTSGDVIASANDLSLGSNGDYFVISGTTQINAIVTAPWQKGNKLRLQFQDALTLKHNTSGGAGTAKIKLDAEDDRLTANGMIIELVYDGTDFRQTGISYTGA